MTSNPYGESADEYIAMGHTPLPVPLNTKFPPPTGYTGAAGKRPTPAKIKEWMETPANVILRMVPGVIGIDVDHGYDKDGVLKDGDDVLRELEAEWGPLPPTYSSTSRGDDDGPGLSRILFYRVPPGMRFISNPGRGSIETIQVHHRYAVVWPSIHPNGGVYYWYDDAGERMEGVPDVDDLPELPFAWIEGLRSHAETFATDVASPEQVAAFLDIHGQSKAAWALDQLGKKLASRDPGTSRHDTLMEMSCWAMREVEIGAYPAQAAYLVLRNWWIGVMDDERRRDGTEFDACIAWAISQAATMSPERRNDLERKLIKPESAPAVADLPADAMVVNVDTPNLPAEFWTQRPILTRIRDAAWSRWRSPDAFLHVVLARVTIILEHNVEGPTGSSLNYCVALVGPPESGKSETMKQARAFLPVPRERYDDVIDGAPLGSGEGLVEQFFAMVTATDPETGKKTTVKEQKKYSALMFADEIDSMTEMGKRSGTTLLATIRTAATGGLLGQTNASQERNRALQPDDYVCSIVIGMQPERGGSLMADAGAGTPQRFHYAATRDPSIPRHDRPRWHGSYTLPRLEYSDATWPQGNRHVSESSGKLRRRMTMDAAIQEEQDDYQYAVHQGLIITDPLDAHTFLLRLKAAALLALIEGRMHVTMDDWKIAGMMTDASHKVRDAIVAVVLEQSRRQETAKTNADIRRTAAIEGDGERRALASAARSVARVVHKHSVDGHPQSEGRAKRPAQEPCNGRCVGRAIASKHRQLGVTVDSAADHAVGEGYIVRDDDGWKPGTVLP